MAYISAALFAFALAAAAHEKPVITGRYVPPPEIAKMTLPSGPLWLLADTDKADWLLDTKRLQGKKDGKVRLVSYKIYKQGIATGGWLVTQDVELLEFDCIAETMQELGGLTFDADDDLVLWMPVRAPVQLPAGSGYRSLSDIVCAGSPIPHLQEFATRAQALGHAHPPTRLRP